MAINLKNNSGSLQRWGGIDLADTAQRVLSEDEYLRLISDSSFLTLLSGGQAQILDGITLLTYAQAVDVLTFKRNVTAQFNSVDIVSPVNKLNFNGDFVITDQGNGVVGVSSSDAIKSIAPGFTWGKPGYVGNTYLLNDSVPSNTSGRLVPFNGFIIALFVSNQSSSSEFIVEIRKRNGNFFSTIVSVSVSNQRTAIQSGLLVPILEGDELACYIKKNDDSAQNPVVGIVLRSSN